MTTILVLCLLGLVLTPVASVLLALLSIPLLLIIPLLILAAVFLAEAIGICQYIFAPQLISLFDSTPGVVALGVRQARTVALFYCLLAFSHAIAAVCRGAGKAFVPMVIMLSVWCVIRIAYIVLVMRLVGDIGLIYWAYPLTWAISSVIYLVYYLRSDWTHGFD